MRRPPTCRLTADRSVRPTFFWSRDVARPLDYFAFLFKGGGSDEANAKAFIEHALPVDHRRAILARVFAGIRRVSEDQIEGAGGERLRVRISAFVGNDARNRVDAAVDSRVSSGWQ